MLEVIHFSLEVWFDLFLEARLRVLQLSLAIICIVLLCNEAVSPRRNNRQGRACDYTGWCSPILPNLYMLLLPGMLLWYINFNKPFDIETCWMKTIFLLNLMQFSASSTARTKSFNSILSRSITFGLLFHVNYYIWRVFQLIQW